METFRSHFACSHLCLAALVLCTAGLVHAEDYRVDYLGKWTLPNNSQQFLDHAVDLRGADLFYYPTTGSIFRLDFANFAAVQTDSFGSYGVANTSLSSESNGYLFILDSNNYDTRLHNLSNNQTQTPTNSLTSPYRVMTSVFSIDADYTQTASTLNVASKSFLYTAYAGGRTGIYYTNFTGTSFAPPVEIYSTAGTKGGQQVWLSDDGTTISLWDPSSSSSGTDNFLRSFKLVDGVWTMQADPVQVATRSFGTFAMASDGTFFLWTGRGAGEWYEADGTLRASFAAPSPGTGLAAIHNINYNSDTGRLVLYDGSGVYGFQTVVPEPGTVTLIGLGALGLFVLRRRSSASRQA
jgi:hypothetical protein